MKKVEMSEGGSIRIVGEHEGDWSSYQHPAFYRDNQGLYVTFTAYYEGELEEHEIEKVFKLVPEGC